MYVTAQETLVRFLPASPFPSTSNKVNKRKDESHHVRSSGAHGLKLKDAAKRRRKIIPRFREGCVQWQENSVPCWSLTLNEEPEASVEQFLCSHSDSRVYPPPSTLPAQTQSHRGKQILPMSKIYFLFNGVKNQLYFNGRSGVFTFSLWILY